MKSWSIEITNDPEKDFRLIYELIENDNDVGRISRNEKMELILELYCEPRITIPIDWLKEIIVKAEKDLIE